MPQVLIIDDQAISRMILEELIGSIEIGATIITRAFEDPISALSWAKENPVDLVITDFKMPNMDGVEFIQWLRKIPSCSDVPVVIITCVEDKSIRYKALESGATDFLAKPIDHPECRTRCKNLLTMRRQQQIIKDRACWLEKEVKETTRELERREKETIFRLAKAGEFRDEDTGNHILRISRYSALIAEEIGLSQEQQELIRHSAPMHDLGKIAIPDHILLKPGKLTPEEWDVMKRHSEYGHSILKDSPSSYLQTGAIIALHHHERFDGSGYPMGLRGFSIPLEARIVAVADVFDALVSKRPYKPAWSKSEALEYLAHERGRHFDPDCADAFLRRLGDISDILKDLPKEPKVNSN
ncbi:response regulator [Candidatus Endoriftia persephonae]|jgi:two-component system response regulator RpfG|nr:two-component system response regulator [Candidatus Endoriftia persephone]USF86159.1 two-component system response regulator [Candidatus Endoriftia persephone]